jgi:AcrR family transcriptional regulator
MDPSSETLSTGVAAAWGVRAPSTRGPKRGLSLGAIVAAGVAVADAEGLAAVSMARVAKELGFTTMSLYRHVQNKDELLQLMWNASARTLGDWTPEGRTWRERLTSWALRQREVVEENIWITRLPMSTPPLAPSSLAWVELGLAALDEVDAPDYVKIRVLGLISQHGLIDARMVYDERKAREAAEETGVETDYATLVRELADPATYPHLTRLVHSEPPAGAPADDPHAEYLFDIGIILDGFEAATRSGP